MKIIKLSTYLTYIFNFLAIYGIKHLKFAIKRLNNEWIKSMMIGIPLLICNTCSLKCIMWHTRIIITYFSFFYFHITEHKTIPALTFLPHYVLSMVHIFNTYFKIFIVICTTYGLQIYLNITVMRKNHKHIPQLLRILNN